VEENFFRQNKEAVNNDKIKLSFQGCRKKLVQKGK